MTPAATLSNDTAARMKAFVAFVRSHIKGDEKGEAQIFCDRLFQAFGHPGIMEAGGTLEFRIHKAKGTRFADLLWRPRLLLEMKRRGERLDRHYRQAFEYWLDLVPDRPQYVVLCNFDEFWIYDLNHQLDEPMDTVRLADLPDRYTALNFLFEEERTPLFHNDRVAVTRQAALHIADLFHTLVSRSVNPVPRETAQRFVLQSVLALFAEDIDLLPRGLFSEIIQDCKKRANSYDIIGGLFRQMANASRADGGRYRGVDYFNGGLFNIVTPIELAADEVELLESASKENWSKVHPAIFGSLFEGSMDQDERHVYGAHFTSETDIYKVVLPTIVRPWRDRIAAARTATELVALRAELLHFRVLDPACGSGNFLYIAYRELKRIELELLNKIYTKFGRTSKRAVGDASLVSASQFFGMDIKPFAIELAKVTLMLGKALALKETRDSLATGQHHLPFDLTERPLPLDNLDANFLVGDALMTEDGAVREWPSVEAVIGNPPFLGSKRLKPLRGASYVNRLRKLYPDVPGLADYCIFWFRRTHDHLPDCTESHPTSGRAGLVGTQNVRNNQSRVGGLDHIAASGTIIEAVDNQPWSGEADVHVSIVNWVKTTDKKLLPTTRRLWTQANTQSTKKQGPRSAGSDGQPVPVKLIYRDVSHINSGLSDAADVSGRLRLTCNQSPKRCFQGKIPGYEGFVIDAGTAEQLRGDSAEVIRPYLTGRELLGKFAISRWVIDFENRGMIEASKFRSAFDYCKRTVLPQVTQSVKDAEDSASDMVAARREHLSRWWQLWNRRDELTAVLSSMPRYIGCSRVTRRPVMVFLSSDICPSDLVQVFAMNDDYSFGILQSALHFEWFRTSSRLKVESDTRYSVRDVFETFPWPQSPTSTHVRRIAAAAKVIRQTRQQVLDTNGGGLRDMYRVLELPGKHALRDAHEELDAAVRQAYGISQRDEGLRRLMELNHWVGQRIDENASVERPGLPRSISDPKRYISDDSLTA